MVAELPQLSDEEEYCTYIALLSHLAREDDLTHEFLERVIDKFALANCSVEILASDIAAARTLLRAASTMGN